MTAEADGKFDDRKAKSDADHEAFRARMNANKAEAEARKLRGAKLEEFGRMLKDYGEFRFAFGQLELKFNTWVGRRIGFWPPMISPHFPLVTKVPDFSEIAPYLPKP